MDHRPQMKPVRHHTNLPVDADKLPPQALEMEQAVLGAILLFPEALNEVSDFLAPEHFYVQAHRSIYAACVHLGTSNDPSAKVSTINAVHRLKATGELDTVGGSFYVSQLASKIGSARDIQFHARIIVQQFIRRQLIATCSESMGRAYDDTADVFDLMDAHNEGLAAINSITSNGDPTNAAEIIARMVDNRDQPLYLHFGMGQLDQHVAMGPGAIVVVGARPAVGKTTFVMNGLMNIAKAGHNSLFLSLEMNEDALAAKITSAITGIDSERITHNDLTPEERGRIAVSATENGVWIPRIMISDLSNLKASQMAGILEVAVKRHGCKVAVLDYLQLMDGEGDSGAERMANISKACKQAAKASGIRLIECSQLKRRDGADVDPDMSDLRESGQIEADGDIIILLGREPGGTELLAKVAKNKTGPIGNVRIPFDLMSQRIGGMPSFDPRALPKSFPPPDNRIEPNSDEVAPF